jgi:hypothetical protein
VEAVGQPTEPVPPFPSLRPDIASPGCARPVAAGALGRVPAPGRVPPQSAAAMYQFWNDVVAPTIEAAGARAHRGGRGLARREHRADARPAGARCRAARHRPAPRLRSGWARGPLRRPLRLSPGPSIDGLGELPTVDVARSWHRSTHPGSEGLLQSRSLRAAGLDAGVRAVTILGEGSFHQMHGGTTTNQADPLARRERMRGYVDHYAQVRGPAFKGPEKPIHYVGSFTSESAKPCRARRMTASAFDVELSAGRKRLTAPSCRCPWPTTCAMPSPSRTTAASHGERRGCSAAP